jgi:nucleoside-diphosphate-sugar epimerase
VRAFKEKGHEVTALARSDQSESKLNQQGIKVQRGDLKNPESYADAVRKADIVVHTASTNDAEFAKYDLLAIDTILEALSGTNNTFIYTSGVWVLGTTGDNIANENTPLNPHQLVTWRADAEKKVVDGAQQGIRTVVLRPSLVYGDNKGIIGGIIEDAKKTGEIKVVGDGENRWPTVHVEDLADLYVLAAEKAPQGGTLFNASHGPSVKVKEVAEQIAKALGTPGKVRPVPVELARTRLGLVADALTLDQQIDATKAQRELGWQPKRPSILEDVTQTVKAPAAAGR